MTPAEVKALPPEKLQDLASDVRARILKVVGANGGHLASSLGAVELAIGLVRAFDPAYDRIVWDVGHQAYAWKILTGRDAAFGTLRRHHGLSGFPNPEESRREWPPRATFAAGRNMSWPSWARRRSRTAWRLKLSPPCGRSAG